MPTVYYRGTRADVRRIIAMVVQTAAGQRLDTMNVRQAIQYRMGNALLSKVQQAFLIKSRGGTDECGIKWPPLAASTIRRRLAKVNVHGLIDQVRRAPSGQERDNAVAVLRLASSVDILRDTGIMLRSMSPGVDSAPSGASMQIFDAKPGSVIVGTNRYPWHHTGIPGRLPARHLWPPDGRLPDSWWTAIRIAGIRGFLAVLTLALSSNVRPQSD